MVISYNTKKAEESQFDSVGPGTYLCEVESAEERTSSKGDPMIALRWRSVEHGFTICWDNLVFNEKGTGIAHKKLKMMGVPLPTEGVDETVAIDAMDLVGLRANLTLVEETYKGKTNLKTDFDADGFGYALAGDAPKDAPHKGNIVSDAFNENIPF